MDSSIPGEFLNIIAFVLDRMVLQLGNPAQVSHSPTVGRAPTPGVLEAHAFAIRPGLYGTLPKSGGMVGESQIMIIYRIIDYPSSMGKDGKHRSTNKDKDASQLVHTIGQRHKVTG